MKKLFKTLSLFAIAGLLSVQTLSVSAAKTCAPGEVEHTNYYLYLFGATKSAFYEPELGSQNSIHNLYAGTDMYNHIKGQTIIEQGQVGIKDDTESTYNGASKNWSKVEFWKYHYEATKNEDPTTHSYTTGNTSYVFSTSWLVYADESFGGNPSEGSEQTEGRPAALANYIKTHWDSLANTDLVTKGTALPTTSIDSPANIETSKDNTLRWHITRRFTNKDNLSGVALGTESDVIYAPGVYYVTYCKSTSNSQFTISYDANGGQNAPASHTGEAGTCEKISSTKPTQSGNTFLGWSTNKAAKEPDANYSAGKEYCGNNGNIVLYAVWQVKSGVSAHLFAFTIVAIAAASALIVANKKGLFRQI